MVRFSSMSTYNAIGISKPCAKLRGLKGQRVEAISATHGLRKVKAYSEDCLMLAS